MVRCWLARPSYPSDREDCSYTFDIIHLSSTSVGRIEKVESKIQRCEDSCLAEPTNNQVAEVGLQNAS